MSPSSIQRPSTKKPWVATGAMVSSGIFGTLRADRLFDYRPARAVAFSGANHSTTKDTKVHEGQFGGGFLRDTSCPSWLIASPSFSTRMKPPMPLETITELAPRLKKKEVSPVELTRACLDGIEKLNPVLNAFIT